MDQLPRIADVDRLRLGLELLRRAIVVGCALCLVAAGPALPALGAGPINRAIEAAE
ncbi:MAG TPA: hypothetical protein PK680_05915 [Novosphingobium sp.]|nr:hypothetical protein [Novosphingobium sp.]HQA17904.1 hypothetical protein [Novosphingobium sp.]